MWHSLLETKEAASLSKDNFGLGHRFGGNLVSSGDEAGVCVLFTISVINEAYGLERESIQAKHGGCIFTSFRSRLELHGVQQSPS